MLDDTQVKDVTSNRVVEYGWIKDYNVSICRRILLSGFEGLCEGKIHRFKDGLNYEILKRVPGEEDKNCTYL